jgi:hypothetical protein
MLAYQFKRHILAMQTSPTFEEGIFTPWKIGA